MDLKLLSTLYDFSGRSAVITGGGGVLGGALGAALAGCNARVFLLDRDEAAAQRSAQAISEISNGEVLTLCADVLQPESLQQAADRVGQADILINAAGGNHPSATTSAVASFFDLPVDALRFVTDLNLLGTVLPCQVFGRGMAERGEGSILNISSMNAVRPLTRIPAYSAAKAAVSNFTQWLAVHMAQNYSPRIRVNAIAPGFFLTEQNRYLLTEEESGGLTERGRSILSHTPMGRFGAPDDLQGAALWLLSPAAAFVTGVLLPIDGGFSAFSGV